MKYFGIILFLFSCSFLVSAKDYEGPTLTIGTSAEEEKEYKLQGIEIKEDGVLVKGEGLTSGWKKKGSASCFIPLKKIMDAPRYRDTNCPVCDDDDYVKKAFFDMFKNAKKPNVSCDIKDGKVVGYNFVGVTKIHDKELLISRGLVFDMASYRKGGDFNVKPKKPSAIEKFFKGAGKLLYKIGTPPPPGK